MAELELPPQIRNAIDTGFDEHGMRYTARHAPQFVRQLRSLKFDDKKITEMMTSSPMLKDEDDPQAHVRSALFILDAGERTRPIVDEGDWTGASNKFVASGYRGKLRLSDVKQMFLMMRDDTKR